MSNGNVRTFIKKWKAKMPSLDSSDMSDSTTENNQRRPKLSMMRSNAVSENDLAVVPRDSNNSSMDRSIGSRRSVQSDIITTKHYDSLVCELRCPGCAKPMVAPIKMCASGHSVCNMCTKELTKCPLCNDQLTENRSVTLEAIAAKAQFTCKNAINGCLVRLPPDLLKWHEQRCRYQIGECFMGRVWGGCIWIGCELDWLDHCLADHSDKMWASTEMELTWAYYQVQQMKPVAAYYIFRCYGETFNLYQIYDKPAAKMQWTLICAAKEKRVNKKFAYEIELFSHEDPAQMMVQRYGCHNEQDSDILKEGRCVTINMGDILRFLGTDKVLHYRLKILQLTPSEPKVEHNKLVRKGSQRPPVLVKHALTSTEGANSKLIPHNKIITGKLPPPPEKDDDVESVSSFKSEASVGEDDELSQFLTAKLANLPAQVKLTLTPNLSQRRKSYFSKSFGMNSIDKDIAEQSDLKEIFKKEFGNSRITLNDLDNQSTPLLTKSKTNLQYEELTKLEEKDVKGLIHRELLGFDRLLRQNSKSFSTMNLSRKSPNAKLSGSIEMMAMPARKSSLFQ